MKIRENACPNDEEGEKVGRKEGANQQLVECNKCLKTLWKTTWITYRSYRRHMNERKEKIYLIKHFMNYIQYVCII